MIDGSPQRHPKQNFHEGERRFACPVGFFRLGRNCYYLSAGVASWRDAFFYCKDRNSTLAILNNQAKIKMLRRYLLGEQFTKLERWIGGIYNWKQMGWEWCTTGEKVSNQNFSKMKSYDPLQFAWHCIIMDPALKYKWNAKPCMKRKHYVCEAPAGRRGRPKRRQMINDSSAPQNLIRPHKKKDKDRRKDRPKKKRKNKHLKLSKKYEPSMWSHGVKLGSRPPMRTQQMNSDDKEKTFLHEGVIDPHKPQHLDQNSVYTPFNSKMNDLVIEKILLES